MKKFGDDSAGSLAALIAYYGFLSLFPLLLILTTILGIVVAFSPAKQITSVWRYEVTMFGLTLFFIALAAFFFFIYGRRKAQAVGVGPDALVQAGERSSSLN